ncbi:MAG: hypothetical protein ACI3ZN_03155 [Candidatus Cryptobacteroides sp.]
MIMIITLEISKGLLQAVKEILIASTTDKVLTERIEIAYDRLAARQIATPDLDVCGGSQAVELNMALAKAVLMQELIDMKDEERARG